MERLSVVLEIPGRIDPRGAAGYVRAGTVVGPLQQKSAQRIFFS